MPTLRLLIPLLLALGLSSCAVFRLPTIQGNVIEQKQVDQLEIGMTPEQVRFLLGGPLVQGSFDPNRWDYVYYYRSPRRQETKRSLNLYFENEKLARIVGQTPPENEKAGDTETPTTVPTQRPVDNTPLPDSSVGAGAEAGQKDKSIPPP